MVHEIVDFYWQGDMVVFRVTSASREGLIHEIFWNTAEPSYHCTCEDAVMRTKNRNRTPMEGCRHVRFIWLYVLRRGGKE